MPKLAAKSPTSSDQIERKATVADMAEAVVSGEIEAEVQRALKG